MHKLLERQLKKALRSTSDGKLDYESLVEVVNATYEEFDKERRLTDRSMELVSKELLELNRRIREQSEATVQAIMDNVIDGIVSVNDSCIIESFNPAAERIFGYSASAVIGQSIDKLIPQMGRHIRGALASELSSAEDLRHEAVGRRKDCSSFPMDLAISQMQVDQRRIFIGVVQDIIRFLKSFSTCDPWERA
jgi:PAS domain S-box-containing protein